MPDHRPRQQPIFLVGVPRSGTTLLAAMLCAHSRLSCGPETHVFDILTDDFEASICSEESWPEAAVDYLFSIRYTGAPIPDHYGISRDELSDYLRSADHSVASVASALPELFMRHIGKTRWVEKTPGHQLQVARIRKHFPHSPIIRILRDPRDVALSLNQVDWGPQTFLDAIFYCYKYDQSSKKFFKIDKLSYSLYYEKLLSSPEEELGALCDFLGESFETGMLSTAQSAQHVNKINEAYKANVANPIDKSRAHAWKNVLTEEQSRQAIAIAGNSMEAREQLSTTLKFLNVVGLDRPLSNWDMYLICKVIRESNVRFWSHRENERPIKTIFVGQARPTLAYKIVDSVIVPLLSASGLEGVARKIWYYISFRVIMYRS